MCILTVTCNRVLCSLHVQFIFNFFDFFSVNCKWLSGGPFENQLKGDSP